MKRLDWMQLLGFQQIASDRVAVQHMTRKTGTKLGGKIGRKDGFKSPRRSGN